MDWDIKIMEDYKIQKNWEVIGQVLVLKSKAFDAHAYWWPRKRSAGGGQAIGNLPCGHCGPVGAPCCSECAKDLIDRASKFRIDIGTSNISVK